MFTNSNSKKPRGRSKKSRRSNKRTKPNQLDVRMRSRKEKRLKAIEFAKGALKATCIIGAIVATGLSSRWVFKKAFYENQEFALTDLRIETNGVLTYPRIVSEGDLREGVNLLSIDIEALRARLEKLPKVKEVKISRHLPNQLSIQVSERFPVAWISCPAMGIRAKTSQRGFMLDAEGHVLPCEALLKKYLSLPTLRARTLPQVKLGAKLESAGVKTALRLIKRSNDLLFDEQIEVAEVDIRNDYSISVYFNTDTEVTFGMEDIEDQLNDLKLILKHANAKNRQVATLNLMVRKNIPITYFNFSGDGIESAPQSNPSGSRPGATSTPENLESEKRLNAIRAILGRG